LLTLALRA
jgi:hypothetical protein